MRLVLLGPPGSGKGTQGERLAIYYGVPHVATGDIIRDHIARNTSFGRQVEAAIASGNFAPDADIIYWVSERLAEPDAASGYVLDGFPRDLTQARSWDAHARETGLPLDAVVELLIPEDTLIERLAGRLVCPVDGESYHIVHRPPRVQGHCDNDGAVLLRRPDDEPEAVRHRLQVYTRVTLPLRDYYRGQGILRSIDAAGDADVVNCHILAALGTEKCAA